MTTHQVMLLILLLGGFAAIALFACTDNDPWDR